jgi:hypothetical protein
MVITNGLQNTDVETVGTWNQPSYLLQRPSVRAISKFYVSNAVEGRPDLIASMVYGAADLDWVLIAFNNPPEILNWPKAGDSIEIVSRDLVYAEL